MLKNEPEKVEEPIIEEPAEIEDAPIAEEAAEPPFDPPVSSGAVVMFPDDGGVMRISPEEFAPGSGWAGILVNGQGHQVRALKNGQCGYRPVWDNRLDEFVGDAP